MTQKEKKNRLRILLQQLKLISLEREAIEKQIGKREVLEKIDAILDEMNEIKRTLD